MEKERIKNIGKTALDVGTDFIPGVSEAKDVAAITKGLKEGDYTTAGIHAAGLALGAVPVVGDIARRGLLTVATKFTKKDLLTEGVKDYKALRGNVDETLDKNTAEELFEQGDDAIEKVRKAQSSARKMDDPGKRPFQDSARKLEKDEITPKEFRKEAFADVEKFTEVEELPTFTESVFSLDKNKREKGIIGLNKTISKDKPIIEAGDIVKARLDIPAYNRYDVYLPQITYKKADGSGADSIFSRTMVIQDVKFPTPTKPAFDISRGKKTKYPHATIDGTVATNSSTKKMYTDQEAHSLAKDVINNDDFVHVGYNPDRGGFFYDRATGMPVFDSPLVVQVGKQVFAKKSAETGVERIGKLRQLELNKKNLKQGRRTLFNEGGIVPMEQQMEMAFIQEGGLKDDGATKDPVSGNDVPIGSMDQEVRDDIPAMLSEGEYVVPADVVRFHGVKLFENLRDEAKIGMSRMEADGRVGGEPTDMEDEEFPFSLEELADIDSEPEGMAEGGIVYAAEGTFAYTPNTRYGQGNRSNMGLELRTMVNPATGRTITIPFYNGRPMTVIPEGFVDKTVADEQALMQQQQNQQQQRDQRAYDRESPFDPDSPFNERNRQQRPKPISEMSPAEIRAYNESMDSTLADVTSKLPIIGTLQRLNENSARRYATEALRSGKNPETNQALDMETKLALQQLLTIAENKSMLGAIADYVTGKGGQTTGVPLYEQANYEQMLTPIDPDPVVTPEIEKQMTDLEIEPSFVAGMEAVPKGGAKVVPAEPEFVYVVVPGKNLNQPYKVNKADAYKFGADAIARIDNNENYRGVRMYSSVDNVPQNFIQKRVRNDYIDRAIGETTIKSLVRNPLTEDETYEAAQQIATDLGEKKGENDTSFLDNVKNFFVSPVVASTLSDDQFSVKPSVDKAQVYNNPGNIEVGEGYVGEVGAYKDGRFVVFSDPQLGFRAIARDAIVKAGQFNGNIEQMYLKYLGGGSEGTLEQRYQRAALDNKSESDNPLETVQNYINNLIQAVGSETIDVNDPTQMQALLEQIVRNENNDEISNFYLSQPEVIREGIILGSRSSAATNADGSVKTLDQLRMEFQPELEAAGLIQAPTTPATATQVASGLQGPDAAINQIPQAQTPVGIQDPSQIPVLDAQTPVGIQDPSQIPVGGGRGVDPRFFSADAQAPVGIQDPSQIPLFDAQTPVGAQDPSEVQQDFTPSVTPAPQVAPPQQPFMPTTAGQMPQAIPQPNYISPTPRRFTPLTEKFGVSGYDPDMAMDREARQQRELDQFSIGEAGEFDRIPDYAFSQPPKAMPAGPDFDPNAIEIDPSKTAKFYGATQPVYPEYQVPDTSDPSLYGRGFTPEALRQSREDMEQEQFRRDTLGQVEQRFLPPPRIGKDVITTSPFMNPFGLSGVMSGEAPGGGVLGMTTPGTEFPSPTTGISPSLDATKQVASGLQGPDALPIDVSPSIDMTTDRSPTEIKQLYGRGFTPEDIGEDPAITTSKQMEEVFKEVAEQKKKAKEDALQDAMGKDEFGRYTDPRKLQKQIGAGLSDSEQLSEQIREQKIRYNIDRAAEVHGVDPSMMKPEYFDAKGDFKPPKEAPKEILDMKDPGISSTGIIATKAKKAKVEKKSKKSKVDIAPAPKTKLTKTEFEAKEKRKEKATVGYKGGRASGGLVKRRSTKKAKE